MRVLPARLLQLRRRGPVAAPHRDPALQPSASLAQPARYAARSTAARCALKTQRRALKTQRRALSMSFEAR